MSYFYKIIDRTKYAQVPLKVAFYRTGQGVTQSSYLNSFNGRMRDEYLNLQEWFRSLKEARVIIEQDYNHIRIVHQITIRQANGVKHQNRGKLYLKMR